MALFLFIKAILAMPRLQPGDVPGAVADVSELQKIVGYKPRVTVEGGVRKFVQWRRGCNGVLVGWQGRIERKHQYGAWLHSLPRPNILVICLMAGRVG